MITITTADIIGMMEYVGTLFEDFKPLLILISGLYLAFYVIQGIIEIVQSEKSRTPFTEREEAQIKMIELYEEWEKKQND